jgi:hypothetical protein
MEKFQELKLLEGLPAAQLGMLQEKLLVNQLRMRPEKPHCSRNIIAGLQEDMISSKVKVKFIKLAKLP